MGVKRQLRRVVSMRLAESFIPGWQHYVILELERMRREFPDAQMLELTLITIDREDDE